MPCPPSSGSGHRSRGSATRSRRRMPDNGNAPARRRRAGSRLPSQRNLPAFRAARGPSRARRPRRRPPRAPPRRPRPASRRRSSLRSCRPGPVGPPGADAAASGSSAPRLVLQVSAAAAARLPVTSQSPSEGSCSPRSAPSAAGPPLAATWSSSRRSPLASGRPGRGARRPTTLLETKKAASTAPPAHPVPTSTSVPTAAAAIAPPAVSVPARHASRATTAATRTDVSRAPARRGARPGCEP